MNQQRKQKALLFKQKGKMIDTGTGTVTRNSTPSLTRLSTPTTAFISATATASVPALKGQINPSTSLNFLQ